MTDRCPFCGTELKETNWGRFFCPNHGIISKPDEIEDDKKDETSYIG